MSAIGNVVLWFVWGGVLVGFAWWVVGLLCALTSEFEVSHGDSSDDVASVLEQVGLTVSKLSAGEVRASYRR